MKTRHLSSRPPSGWPLLAVFPVFVDNPYYIHLRRDHHDLRDPAVRARHRGRLHRPGVARAMPACSASAPTRPACWSSSSARRCCVTLRRARSASRRCFGAMLALPALRVTGPYLAMVTLAFGTIIQILINEMDFLTNGPMGIKLAEAACCSATCWTSASIFWLVAVLLVVSLRGRASHPALAPRPRVRGACAAARSRPTAWASRCTATRSTRS